MPRSLVWLLSLACLPTCGCVEEPAAFERTIVAFLQAVQEENLDALYCLMAGASGADGSRAAFDAWARGRYRAYLDGRDRGAVDLGDDGIALVKAFTLGRGTYYEVSAVRRRDRNVAVVDTLVRFAYGEIDVSGFPPGTVFYPCGTPVGRIERVTVPAGRETMSEVVLDTIEVRWTLVRSAGTAECAERWTVASVLPVPSTATTSRVTWLF